MTREQFRAFLATPKGKLVAVCTLMVASWIFLLFYFFGDALAAFGNPRSLDTAKQELKRQRAAHRKVAEKFAEWTEQKKRYRAIVTGAWKASLDGPVETALRQKVADAAAALEFRLSSLGSVATGRINNDLYYADIDVSAEGGLDEIIKLISALEAIRPAPVWKRLSLRPDMRPRPQSSGSSIINLAQQENTVEYTRISMNGTLRVVCVDESTAGVSGGERRVTR